MPSKFRQNVRRQVREAARPTSRGAGRLDFTLSVGTKSEDSEQQNSMVVLTLKGHACLSRLQLFQCLFG